MDTGTDLLIDCIKYLNHPHLTVTGFVRKTYRHSVPPIALLELMGKYYDSWVQRRFTKEEMDKLREITQTERYREGVEEFDFYSTTISDIQLDFKLRFTYLKSYSSNEDIHVELFAEVSSGSSQSIKFISGRIGLSINDDHCVPEWRRNSMRYGRGMVVAQYQIRDEELYELKDRVSFDEMEDEPVKPVVVSCYLDVDQIKFDGSTVKDFDIVPVIEMTGKFKLTIGGSAMERMLSEVMNYKECDGWTILYWWGRKFID